MGKKPPIPNRPLDHMDVVVIKEQLEDVEKQVGGIVTMLSGSTVGSTKIKGLVDMFSDLTNSFTKLSAEVAEMIRNFQHAEKWRKDFKEAQAEHEARNEKKRQLAEQREFEAAQKDRELATLRRSSMIKNWIAIGTALAGFLAKELWDKFF